MNGTIEAIAMDFDGVLTDGGFWWGPDGSEWKRLCFSDVMGVSLGTRGGLRFAIISGEDSPLIDRYATKMGIADIFKGCKDKAAALKQFSKRSGVALDRIAYIGDDVNDLEAMRIAGFSAAPSNAHPSVRATVTRVMSNRGGDGAVRELIDGLLETRRVSASTVTADASA
jgi:3-deoxy-D-manno-octulosonate 8-phosphate phosphatase (KDO 8-P phosphatase)